MYLIKKNINIKMIILPLFISLLIGSIVNSNKINNFADSVKQYLDGSSVILTYYYSGDATGSGACTGSGKCTSEFSVNSNGWYIYTEGDVNYLVVAAATNICLNTKSGACGNYNSPIVSKYYDYGDKLVLEIGGVKYNAIVLDSCGACMRSTEKPKIDIFVSSSKAVNPGSLASFILGESASSNNNTEGTSASNGFIYSAATTYSGDFYQGYVYKQLEFKFKETDDKNERIDNVIQEIFNRAGDSYKNTYNSGEYNDNGTQVDTNGFIKRTIAPSRNNALYYSNKNQSYAAGYLGECVWYSNGRAKEILSALNISYNWTYANNGGDICSSKDASNFGRSSDYTKPKVGALISWTTSISSGAEHNYGHVGVIEGVNYDGNGNIISVSISESSKSIAGYFQYSSSVPIEKIRTRGWKGYNFRCYIYLDEPKG